MWQRAINIWKNWTTDKAEESYLSAIKVDPKEEEPYLSLADLYVSQEEYDKAIAILEQAEKNTSNESTAVKDKKNQINEQKAGAEAGPGYSWVVQPEIEADEIYYLRKRMLGKNLIILHRNSW